VSGNASRVAASSNSADIRVISCAMSKRGRHRPVRRARLTLFGLELLVWESMKTRPYISLMVLLATIVLFMPPRQTLAAGPAMKVVQSPNEVTWAPAPASLPSGAQLAVISGDASKRGGTYALRLKMPDGYVFKPHVLNGSAAQQSPKLGVPETLSMSGSGAWVV
jgi:hypothetical protein